MDTLGLCPGPLRAFQRLPGTSCQPNWGKSRRSHIACLWLYRRSHGARSQCAAATTTSETCRELLSASQQLRRLEGGGRQGKAQPAVASAHGVPSASSISVQGPTGDPGCVWKLVGTGSLQAPSFLRPRGEHGGRCPATHTVPSSLGASVTGAGTKRSVQMLGEADGVRWVCSALLVVKNASVSAASLFFLKYYFLYQI